MNFRRIDMTNYPRKDHFDHFRTMEYPFVTITVQVDIRDWIVRLKKAGYPLFLCFQYAVAQAANRVPEFRQRIVGDGIIEYEHCYPSYTVALPDETYRYCMVKTDQPLEAYLEEARVKQEKALHAEHLEEEGDPESHLYTSCVPWQDFTGGTMPYPDSKFSIPNVVWGKYKTEKYLAFEGDKVVEKEKTTIPVVIFVNHALIDGLHISKFYSYLDEELAKMEF